MSNIEMIPSILKRGTLEHRTLLSKTHKFAVLCAPRTTTDIGAIYTALFGNTSDTEDMVFIGNLASSAIKHTPILILMSMTQKPETAHFIHFTQVIDFEDENTLNSGCHFSLNCVKAAYKFRCKTSIAYQEWAHAIENGVRIAKGQALEPTPNFQLFMKKKKSFVHVEEKNVSGNAIRTPSISDDEDNNVVGKMMGDLDMGLVQDADIMKSVSWKTVEVVSKPLKK